jgi:multidrug/hemolysin transport system permease protein
MVSRNVKLYFRDKSAVFFSLFTMLIIIGLYVLFLGNITVQGIQNTVGDVDGVRWMVDSWIMAGVISVNAVSVPMMILGVMIEDKENKRIDGFLVAPISRTSLVLGYIVSTWLIGFVMCVLSLAFAQFYIVVYGGQMLSVTANIQILGLIGLNVLSGTAMMFLIMGIVKTVRAYGSFCSIVGTLIGFVTGVYIPIGNMPDAVQTVMKLIPATHGTVLMRQIMTEDALNTVFTDAPEYVGDFRTLLGIDLELWGVHFTPWMFCTVVFASAILFFGCSVFVMRKKKKES